MNMSKDINKEFKPDIWDVMPIPDDHLRPQDDIPYERMMLRIIEDYRRLKSSIKKASRIICKQRKELDNLKSTKVTKEDYIRLQMALTKKNEKIKSLSDGKKNQKIQQLRLEIEDKDRIIKELKGE